MVIDLLKKYTSVSAVSGEEYRLRNAIIEDIKEYADSIKIDALGNMIVFKKGKQPAKKKVMIDAHMDEIGMIITSVGENGYLRFSCVGGIDAKVLFGKRVRVNGAVGVIGGCAYHLLDGDKNNVVDADKLFIDIGAASREEALEIASPGDFVSFDTESFEMGDKFAARAIDDRVGCAVMVDMIRNGVEYDTYFSFAVGEEIGSGAAACAAYSIEPDFAVIVEATTASDLYGAPAENRVCAPGKGPAISFMDRSTLYDREMYEYIIKKCEAAGVKTQFKTAVTGGNDAGSIHKSRGGVRCTAISLASRYIHSGYCVASVDDVEEIGRAVRVAATALASGEFE